MEQLHFITKLLDIKDPNIKILDIINMDTHKEIIAKLDYEAPSCPDCGSLMKKYDFQKPSKIPYLETTGMPSRILLRKRRFKCYHCSKMMVDLQPKKSSDIFFLTDLLKSDHILDKNKYQILFRQSKQVLGALNY
ncbi:degenerate transposase [Streptococcus pneumoniae]|nr:degenerate transposase [Streptococcus pneumoniae]